jgi:hypothetical protein
MVRRLRQTISLQTLATYELGTRAVPVFRLNEVCGALGVRASAVLAVVEEQVFGSTPAGAVAVDLRQLASTSIKQLGPARRWAASLLAAGAQPVMLFTAHSRTLLAELCGIDQAELKALLNTVHMAADHTDEGGNTSAGD